MKLNHTLGKAVKIVLLSFFLFNQTVGFAQESAPSYDLPLIESEISVPIVIPLQEINRLINNSVTGIIFEDNSYTDNNNDQFKARVEKKGNIVIKGLTNNRLMISIPLKIRAEQGYGTLGVYTYQTTNFEVTMTFISDVALRPDWRLKTTTRSGGFEWMQKPVLNFGGVKIPIASIVEKKLQARQGEFAQMIDKQVLEHMDLSSYLLKIWNYFSNPIQISPEYNTWLRITPDKLTATPITVFSNQIQGTLGVKLFSETFVGGPPPAKLPLLRVPNYTKTSKVGDLFKLQTTVNIPYEEATRLARQQFLDKEIPFRDGKSSVTVRDIKLYEDDGRVVIEAKTEGTIDGVSFISGIPVYDATKKMIVLKDSKFKLRTSNILQKTMSSLFKGKIVRMIEEEYGIPMGDMETEAKKNLKASLNQEYYPGVKMQGDVFVFEPSDIFVRKEGLTAIINTQARMKVKVQGISF